MNDIHCSLLADHSECIPMLAELYVSEWEPYYGTNGPGDAHADLKSRRNRDEMPIGLVAAEGEQILGTAALDLDAATGLTPSVVGLFVVPAQRGRGVATALFESSESLARRLGYSRLYVSSSVPGNALVRMGWFPLREVQFLNDEQGFIYAKDL